MPKLAAGVVKFQKEVFPDNQELFETLSHGQSPQAFFLTCSDSRIEVAMLTQSKPGDLFICRNAGNIIPPHTKHTGAVSASLEYAVSVLKVPHIVVCGHSQCGAMAAAISDDPLDELPHVKEWLGYSKAAVDIVNEIGKDLSEDERMQLLLEQNVLLQLQHVRTHPSVAVRVAKGDLKLHGWVYDIKSGGVRAYSDEEDAFLAVDVRYAEDIAAAAAGNCGHS
jgi:carbonic anhydrase